MAAYRLARAAVMQCLSLAPRPAAVANWHVHRFMPLRTHRLSARRAMFWTRAADLTNDISSSAYFAAGCDQEKIGSKNSGLMASCYLCLVASMETDL
jgi:hypothetical protein